MGTALSVRRATHSLSPVLGGEGTRGRVTRKARKPALSNSSSQFPRRRRFSVTMRARAPRGVRRLGRSIGEGPRGMSQQQQYPLPYQPYPPSAGLPPGAGPAWGYTPGPIVGRPGILTAIGVVSIIVASVSMLASFGTGGFGLMTRRIVQMQRVQASAAIASARVASQAPGQGGSTGGGPTILGAPDPAAASAEPELGPEGMEPPDRRVVATALDQ